LKAQAVRKGLVEKIPVPERMFFFRSCVASNKYPGIETGAVDALKILGVEMVETDDQTCCGGFVTFANVAAPTASMPAVARNLSLAEERDLDVCVVCNGCWTFLNEFAHFMNGNQEVKKAINMMLGMMGRSFKGTSGVYHVAELFYRLKDCLTEKVAGSRPLKGLRVATHYGCHYLNSGKYTAIDDPFYPTFIEELVEIMGGTNVWYEANRECCGTGFSQVINNKEVSYDHTEMKLDSLQAVDPDFTVVICPYCFTQLDRMQQQLHYRRGKEYDLPVVHISQLVGLALGVPTKRLAFDAHMGGRAKLGQVLKHFD